MGEKVKGEKVKGEKVKGEKVKGEKGKGEKVKGEKGNASAVIVPLRPRGCAHCGKPMVARWRPFCSKRCADLDLGRWLSETYRIATNEEAELDMAADEDDGADR